MNAGPNLRGFDRLEFDDATISCFVRSNSGLLSGAWCQSAAFATIRSNCYREQEITVGVGAKCRGASL